MYPVLLSVGGFSISSFGLFLSLAFLVSIFTIWRICRFYEMPEEKVLDISLLTFFGGLIGSRILYAIGNPSDFDTVSKVILINRYPGLSFWGGVIGGLVTLVVFSRRFKLVFWTIADFVALSIFAGLVLGSIGCLLGSCQSGIVDNGPLAVTQIGLVGTRFPIQFFEAIFFLLGFWYLWKMSLKFHFPGEILSLSLVILGIIKFVADFWRGEVTRIMDNLTSGQIFAILVFLGGIYVFYSQSRRSVTNDVRYVFTPKFRKTTLPKFLRSCYNLMVNLRLSFNKSIKGATFRTRGILKNLNVKSQPPKL